MKNKTVDADSKLVKARPEQYQKVIKLFTLSISIPSFIDFISML